MPRTKSAKKALRQSRKRAGRNLQTKTALKTALKKTSAKNLDKTFSQIDKAQKRYVISKKKAARLKSRMVSVVDKGK